MDAVALFRARARAHDPGFDLDDANALAVAEICRRLDGLPLAIELAAARCGLLSAGEIAERLQDALGALGTGARDAPARQKTLRATIDWSHELLSDDERQCFARFAVFAGGAQIRAAETVTQAGLDTLDGLVAKNLLVRHRDANRSTRLGMLETVRAYAGERFARTPDKAAAHERHFLHYLTLAQRHGDKRALWGAGGEEHLAGLDPEMENLHSALAWAVGHAKTEWALAMAQALGRYWVMRDRYADALEWIDQILRLPDVDAYPVLRVGVLCTKAISLWPLGRGAEQAAVVAAAETIARRSGDPVSVSQALQLRVDQETSASHARLDALDALAEEALRWAKAAGDEWEVAEALRAKARAASTVADLRQRVDTAATLLTEAGNVYQLGNLLTYAAYSALCLGGDRDAADFAARATPIARALGSRWLVVINSGNIGLAALLTGETDTASHAFREELRVSRELVVRPLLFEGLRGLAAVAAVAGDVKRAATLVGAADAHRYGEPDDPVDPRLDKAFLEPVRARCGTEAWDAATREGRALGYEDAIAYALEETGA